MFTTGGEYGDDAQRKSAQAKVQPTYKPGPITWSYRLVMISKVDCFCLRWMSANPSLTNSLHLSLSQFFQSGTSSYGQSVARTLARGERLALIHSYSDRSGIGFAATVFSLHSVLEF